MNIYYDNTEYEAGKHKVLLAIFDRDVFAQRVHIGVPYSVLRVDEVDPENKDTCRDVHRTYSSFDENGEGKYFVDSDGDLCENVGWEEYVPDEEA